MKVFLFSLIFFCAANSHGYDTTRSTTQAVDDKKFITVDYLISTHSAEADAHLEEFQRIVGTMFYPFSTVKVVKKINSKIYANVKYEIGEFGLRNIDNKFLNLKAKKHLIIAGDSLVFGDGNNDEDTLTAKMSAKLPSYYLYNFGNIGGAPNYTLSLMENYPWSQLVHEPDGLFVYYFNVETQMQWVIGSWQVIKWSLGLGPYYKLDWGGQLVRQGNFNDRFFLTAFYKWLNQFSWASKLGKDYPRPDSGDVKLVVQIFKRMKESYLEQFPNAKFAIAIKSSETPYVAELIQKMKIFFQEEKIDFIEMASGSPPPGTVLLPLYDYHPNGAGNSLVASELVEKLAKINSLTR